MKNKYNRIIFFITIAFAILTSAFIMEAKKNHNTSFVPSAKGFAVVELFTSEGCSSCPAADETIARLLKKDLENVYILAYHVDYWNRLGWKDQFSSAAYSQRQSNYSDVISNSSVYTPQVIVNGTTEFVGSDESKLSSVVEKDLQSETKSNLDITLVKTNNTIVVAYNIENSDGLLLNLALVQPQATTSVKRGENSGRTLHHVNIVRALTTVAAAKKGEVKIEIPNELSGMPLQVIAFTQNKNNLKIVSAEKKSI